MSAKVDVSPSSVVVWCEDCPSWTAMADDLERGHDVAVAHEADVHSRSRTAEFARLKYQQRKKLASNAA